MKKTSRLRLYKAYVVRGKDPVIDEIKNIIENQVGDLSSTSLRDVQKSGGPAASTLRSWLFGKTRRPNNTTVEAAGRALGFKRVWVDHRPNTKPKK